jgi:hypothetical protein
MKRITLTSETLLSLLRPETPLERTLLTMPDIQAGLVWGEPRFGHPEGKVGYHVREVLDNVDRIPNLTSTQRTQLRLVALTHDAFKNVEDRSTPRNWYLHHGAIAARFMAQHTTDPVVLDIIATHDDAYYAWLNEKRNAENLRFKTLDSLFERVGYCLQMYYLFFKCDTQTGDKTQASVKWFEQRVEGITVVDIPRF